MELPGQSRATDAAAPSASETRAAAEREAGGGRHAAADASDAGGSDASDTEAAEASDFPLTEDGRFLIDGRWRAPVAIMGRVPSRSVAENAPGYEPPNDPEAESVLRGRREVPPNDMQLTGGFESAAELAEEVLAAAIAGDTDRLTAARVTYEEFEGLLWYEFPQSRPITNIKPEDAFGFLFRECGEGIRHGIQEAAGRDLELTGIGFASPEEGGGLAEYTNFNLLQGIQFHTLTPEGDLVVLEFARTFVEKDGVWKVYIYKD
ncbi:MAG: hypothetical protein GF330_06730 [Candidatus Eisenbacteria bacterium]|nr:hypothetical protein [Candidatus Eisenbacteria bacterium]